MNKKTKLGQGLLKGLKEERDEAVVARIRALQECEVLRADLEVAVETLEKISRDKWRLDSTTGTYQGPTASAIESLEALNKIRGSK